MLDISELDKDALAEYALNVFDVSLDMRKGIDKLKAEVKALQEKPKLEKAEIQPKANATHIKNMNTGLMFPWTIALSKHLGSSGIDCNADGEPV